MQQNQKIHAEQRRRAEHRRKILRRRRLVVAGGCLLVCLALVAGVSLIVKAVRGAGAAVDAPSSASTGSAAASTLPAVSPNETDAAETPASEGTAAESTAPESTAPESTAPSDDAQNAFTGTATLPITEGDWQLTLVNPWNAMEEGYVPTLVEAENGYKVDERCVDALREMLADCRAAGLSPLICSAYRTQEKQESLFENKIQRVMKQQGLGREAATVEAAKVVAIPGTSEHQLGLAVDLVAKSNQALDESQEKTAEQKWLMENSWRYGFILRYPNEKSSLTGIIYEPWHYRYVGKEYAAEIYEQGVCLEEYLGRVETAAQ